MPNANSMTSPSAANGSRKNGIDIKTLEMWLWDAAEANIQVRPQGKVVTVPIRWTVVLEQRDGKWLWLHRHSSVAASGQAKGTAYPTE